MEKLFQKKDRQKRVSDSRKNLDFKKSVIGIDIGTTSVNVAQMAQYKGKAVLVKTRIVDIVTRSGSDNYEETLKALHAALKEFRHRNFRYACVVSCPQTCVRKIIMPNMPKEDLRGAVNLDVKRSIPFSLDDAVLDYHVSNKTVDRGIEKLSIIVAASPKKTVERLISFFMPRKAKPFTGTLIKKSAADETLEPLNLKIEVLLPLALCLENVIERSRFKIDETLVTIEMGTSVTELNIFKNSRLQFSRKIPFSGDDVTRSLTGALMTDKGKVELTLDEAERIKREYGIPKIEENRVTEGKITTNQILSLIRPKFEQLTNEIERSFDYYLEEMRGSKVDRIVLFGGGAQIKGLPEFLSRQLGLEVNVGNPLADIEQVSDDVVRRETDAHRLVLAIGAALSGMKGINLLPAENKQKPKRLGKKAVFNAGVMAALFLITVIPIQIKINSLEKNLNIAGQRLTALTPRLDIVKERIIIEQLLAAQPYWDDMLKEISNVIPANMYLRNIRMKDGLFSIDGSIIRNEAPPDTALSQFMVDLEGGIFKNVRLIKTEINSQDADNLEFEISCMAE